MAVPTGVIVIWSGLIVNIPAGWNLCDGTNSTPDLRSRFLIGAGLGLAPDDTGGSNSHSHNFTSDGHTHTIGTGVQIAAGTDLADETDSDFDTGTTDTANNLPPYYALAYIMKI